MRLILIVLCLVAAGFYVNTLFPLDQSGSKDEAALAQTAVEPEPGALRQVPESQLAIIRDVFAPEIQ